MKSSDEQDIVFMQMALDLAKQGQYSTHPNPRVGCVMVKDGKVIASGLHWKAGFEHAEINALKLADCKDATCYVTLEPCSHIGKTNPCVNALIAAKIKRVVIANIDPNPQVKGKGIQALLNAGIDVSIGVLEKEATELNKGFFARMNRGAPYVRAKIGMSLDGKVAMQSGESQWITGPASRLHVQQWRAQCGAIITGSETVIKDDCRLTVREIETFLPDPTLFTQPLRVVIDSRNRVPRDKAIFQQSGKTLIATTAKPHMSEQDDIIILPQKNGKVDLSALLKWLGEKEINDVLIEAGPTLVGALLQDGLIDELLLYIAPKILGSEAKSFAAIPGLTKLSDCLNGEFIHTQKIEKDMFVIMKLKEDEF